MAPITIFLTFCLVEKKLRKPLYITSIVIFTVITALRTLFFSTDIFFVSAPFCLDGEFHIFGPSMSAFLVPRSSKVVYYGKLSGVDVVIKKIRSKSISDDKVGLLDSPIAKLAEFMQFRGEEVQSLLLCPTTKGIADLIQGKTLKDMGHFGHEFISESLLLQLLPAEDDWPIPRYFGRCDDTIVEEYIGSMLSHINFNSWKVRASIAVDLLRLAEKFTFKHENFSFYFTDLSPDNLSVREDKVYLIDLENVIIVDRRDVYINATMKEKWEKIHVSVIFEEEFFTFSSSDVCSHKYSDHNFYAVCAHILAQSDILNQGILQDLPDTVQAKYPAVSQLLQECAHPQSFNNRIEAGRELLKLLEATSQHS